MIDEKVAKLLVRHTEIEQQLSQGDIFSDQKRYKELSREHTHLSRIKQVWEDLQKCRKGLSDNQNFLREESDDELLTMLREDSERLKQEIEELEGKLANLLVPPDPHDHCNTILELRAGTGGDEAALFVGDCVRMYQRYADEMGWQYERLGSTPSERGGYKEYIMVLSGTNVHRFLQYEGGTHRVQRVPETETQGRVHTSAITLAVMLEPEEEEKVVIDEKELQIDTYRASGAGGQHVNVTDSAVRITHVPTGLVTTCQEERSQHKNKEKALRLLKAKIGEKLRQEKAKAEADLRQAQVGTGDRSEKIRTYNFPQNRITDHRINLTKYNLDQVMEGALAEMTEPLVQYFYQQKFR